VRTVPGLHQVLRLRRPTALFDCETTGTDKREARIVQMGCTVWHPTEGRVRRWATLVRPGIPIPPATTKVHGITDAMVAACRNCGLPEGDHAKDHGPGWHEHPASGIGCVAFSAWPTFRQLAPRLKASWEAHDFAGKNIRFDLRVTAAEFARNGVEWTYAGALVLCSDAIARIAEPRTLAALYKRHMGREMENAHDAMADVDATAELMAAQLEDYPGVPRTAEELHAASWPDYIDTEGYFVKDEDGLPRVGRWGKHNGWLMRDVPADYWKYMTRKDKDFPPDAKEIAAAAIKGRFPGDPPPEPERQQGDLLGEQA
jgi:DNA polymerase-3 subunit epsilon